MSFCLRQRIIISTQQWLSVPWHGINKSWRDLLYDIATNMTCTIADQTTLPASSSIYIQQVLHLDTDMKTWQDRWYATASRLEPFDCWNECTPRSCICHVLDMQSNQHDVLLRVECLALQLLIGCEIWQTLHEVAMTDGASAVFGSDQAREYVRLTAAAKCLSQALDLPYFWTRNDIPEVLTEGKCRSVLPMLALKAHERVESSIRPDGPKPNMENDPE